MDRHGDEFRRWQPWCSGTAYIQRWYGSRRIRAYTRSALLRPRIPLLSLSSNPNLQPPSTRFSFLPLRFKGVSAKPINKRVVCEARARASMAVQVEVFEKEELAVSLAQYVTDLSNKFTHERGAFTICLSGGSLIKYLQKLLEPPYVDSLEWPKWHVFWIDERVVPKTHEDSNYKLALDGLLSKYTVKLVSSS